MALSWRSLGGRLRPSGVVVTVQKCQMSECSGTAFGKAVPRCHRPNCPGGTITNNPSPMAHPDGRRTASNFVDCLLGDVRSVLGPLTSEAEDVLRDRFHAAVKVDRRIRERYSKKRRREIIRQKSIG